MPSKWSGYVWTDGELRRLDVTYDPEYGPTLWMSDNLRDDVSDVDDIDSDLFFEDKEHFAAWVTGHGEAITPEDIWNGNIS